MDKNAKHILLLGAAYPYRGGLAAFNERLAYALQEEGHRVELITFTLQYPDFLFPGKTQFSDDDAPEGLHIERHISSVNPLNWLKVGRELRQRKADVIITAFWLPFMGPSMGAILRLVGLDIQRIGLIHNIIPHEKRIFDRTFARYFARANDRFICLSTAVQEELKQFTAAPALCSPHPVYDSYGELISKQEARTYLGLEQDTPYLLFFGFIRDYKGLDLLLEAMVDPRLKQRGVRLIVAGEYYNDQEKYEQQIARLQIADRLNLHTHFIANQEVRYYFCAADLVVQPYRTATQSGISQLAYFFEKPMVVTRVGGLPEIVPDGEAGYVVDQQAIAIADAVVDFYENGKEEVLKSGVLAEKKRFSWEGFVEVLSRLF
ncbi:MAG: glycosyltransferase [Bacteroidota bacterium]